MYLLFIIFNIAVPDKILLASKAFSVKNIKSG